MGIGRAFPVTGPGRGQNNVHCLGASNLYGSSMKTIPCFKNAKFKIRIRT